MTAKLSNDIKTVSSGDFAYVIENIKKVRENIECAALKAGRNPEDITLMAVTKTMPAQAVAAAFSAGVTHFGENRVQELLEKLPQLDMTGRSAQIIGHLQTNKVKMIIDKADMIQSLDSLHLAAEIDRQAEKSGRVMDVLIEVNAGKETSKSGVVPEEVADFTAELADFKHLKVRGLMSIPPFNPEKEKTRPYFQQIRKLFIDISAKKSDNIDMSILSMGMSADYDIAIEEGATLVRVGTAIFGKRNYTGG